MNDQPLTLEEATAEIRRLSQLVQDLDHAVFSTSTSPPHSSPPATLLFPTLDAWMRGYFTQVYLRPIGGQQRWCAYWWEHAEAAIRLEALWRTWEAARLQDAAAMSLWHLTHLDAHLSVLLHPAGPFAACNRERHYPLEPLPVAAAPPDSRWVTPQKQ